jgi:ABC-2 type transport system ATP-binding protein
MIEAQGIRKTYGDHQALKGLDLSIPKGSIFGLLGPNGAGKTTFIRILNQILAPDEGQVLFNGEPLKAKHIGQIGYLPEERGLYPKMKVAEQLLYLAQLKGLKKDAAKNRIAFWLKRFDLTDRKNAKVEELSKGLAQKVQFIASVIHEPKLLILDEPFTGFDPINAEHIKNEILRLNQDGATIIFSTHRMESVEQLCEEIVLINEGAKLLNGRLSQIKAQHRSGWFWVETNSKWEFSIPKNWEVETIVNPNAHQYRVHIGTSQSAELMTALMPSGIKTFMEEEPSLNEIFIKSLSQHE